MKMGLSPHDNSQVAARETSHPNLCPHEKPRTDLACTRAHNNARTPLQTNYSRPAAGNIGLGIGARLAGHPVDDKNM